MASTGKSQRKNSRKGRQRGDDLKNYWRGPSTKPLVYGSDEWRVIALRGRLRRNLDVSDMVTSVRWDDNGPILTGSVGLQKPAHGSRVDIGEGHVLRLDHRRQGGGRFREVWRMRIGGPVENQGTTINVKENSYEWGLADDLALLAKGSGSFKHKKDKRHPKGWLVHEIIIDVCRQYGVPVAKLPKMKHRVKNLAATNTSPLDYILKAIRQENTNRKQDYRVRWRRGRLEVVRKQRSAAMHALSDTIIEATLTRTRKAGFATQLKVNATPEVGKGKDSKGRNKRKKRKFSTTVTSKKLSARFGLIRRSITVEADSIQEARKKAKRRMAKLAKTKDAVTFTHPGIPSLRRHHALRLSFPDQGFKEICYVTSVSHSVSPGQYDMEVTVQFSDPFKQKPSKKNTKTKKCDAAQRRGRKLPDYCERRERDKPKPKRARQREDDPKPKAKVPARTPGQQLSDRAYR